MERVPMHLNDDRIQRLIDGELSTADQRSARTHLAECATCRVQMDAAGDDASAVSTLLLALDGPAPAISFDRIEARARSRRTPWRRSAIGWAVAAVVAVAAVAAPGSPV